MINELEEYLKQTDKNEINVLNYIRNIQPDLLLDLENVFPFLSSTNDEFYKAQSILDILKVREYSDNHRIHKKGYQNNPYNIYKEHYDNTHLDEKTFTNLYKTIDKISLVDEFAAPSINVKKALEILGDEAKDVRLLRYIKEYYLHKHKIDYEKIIRKSETSFNMYISIISKYKDIEKIIKPNSGELLELACFANKTSLPQTILEDRFVYQKFRLLIDDSKFNTYPLIVINPPLTFIRKWINKNGLFNRRTIFVLENMEILSTLNTIYSSLDAISFISINELLKTYLISANKITDILIFLNNTINKSEIANLINQLPMALNKNNNIYIFTQDSFITKNSSNIKQALKNYYIKTIFILPYIKIDSISSNKYILLKFCYSNTKNENIEIKGFSNGNSQKQSITTILNTVYINYNDFFKSDINIRGLFYNQTRDEEKKSNKERNAPQEFYLTENISIYYTNSNVDETHRVKAFFINPLTNQRILNSVKSTKKQEYDIIHWLKHEYISKIDRKDLIEIKEFYKQSLTGIDISLDTFLFFEDKIYNTIPDDYKYLYDILLESNIASLPLSSINQYDLDLFINSIDKATYRQILTIINSIFSEAVKKSYIQHNPCSSIMAKYEKDYDLYSVNRALSKRFLYNDEIKKIIKYSMQLINRNNMDGLIILLRLITGLEPNIICALDWSKFVKNEVNGTVFYSLIINIELSNDGTHFVHFERRENYIEFPLPSFLSNILLDIKNKRLNGMSLENEDYLNSSSIIKGNDNIINGQFEVFSPKKGYINNRKIFKKLLKCDEDIIYVPNNKGGSTELNLAYYQGDIFKSNFEHLAKIYNNFDIDEINYLLRRQSNNVFSNNYCDYRNPYSQLKIFKMLEEMWSKYYD